MNWKCSNSSTSVEEWILSNLGVKTTQEINEWFIKSRKGEYKVLNLDKAVALLQKNKDKNIVICGDYDADGIMAVSILSYALKEAGFEKVHSYIPYRHTEGYGLNNRMVDEIYDAYKSDVCMITVDNGIVAFEPLRKARDYGWDVIVTDHHLGVLGDSGSPLLPLANVVIDPAFIEHTADFSGYCGAGLAYKIAVELLGYENAKILMPFAAIATFADVMELKEENYVFARDGLRFLNKGIATPGLLALVKANRMDTIEDMDVLFKLAPEINAPGRLEPNGAEKCVQLMLADKFTAYDLATEVISANEARKFQVAQALDAIMPTLNNEEDILVRYLPNTNPGIVGIIAGQVTESKKKPSIVLTNNMSDDTMLTGSCRSVEGVHMKNLLDEISETIVAYGGHAGAAGVNIKKEDLEAFTKAAQQAVKNQNPVAVENDVEYFDFEIENKNIKSVIETMNKFAPFGEGNPKPVFKVINFQTLPYQGNYYRELAKEGVKFSSYNSNAIAFGMLDEIKKIPKDKLKKLNFFGKLSMNHFRGTNTPQIEFVDFEF